MAEETGIPSDDYESPYERGDLRNATATLYDRLRITDEEVGEVRETDDGDLEIDVSFFAWDRKLIVNATVRMSREPAKSSIVRLDVTSTNVWENVITGELVEMLPRPTIRAAFVAASREADDKLADDHHGGDAEDREVTTDVLAALGNPGALPMRSYPDAVFIDLAARVAEVMQRPRSDYPPRTGGPTKGRALTAIGRLWLDEERQSDERNAERKRAGKPPKKLTVADERSSRRMWKKELDEAIRRGFLDKENSSLTAEGIAALHAKALADRAEV